MSKPELDIGDADGDTLRELTGLYIELDEAAAAVAEIARRGYEIELDEHRASGMVEIQAHEPPEAPADLTGLYASFEAAADAVARLARRGLATEVDVAHPTGRTNGPAVEVRLAGALEDRWPPTTQGPRA